MTATAMVAAGLTLGSAPAYAAPPGDFSTSFETGQPQPAVSTAEIGADGKPRQANVIGALYPPGSLMGEVDKVTASEENAPDEVGGNLTDGDANTKWLAFTTQAWVQYDMTKPVTAVTYSLTSANDAPTRDPKDFALQGSTDGKTWVDLDTQSGFTFPAQFATKKLTIATPAAYQHYRLNVTATAGASLLQLADWTLSDGSTTQPSDSPMVSMVGNGPISGYNIRPGVGWTGTKALRFGGSHTAAGRGYAWNRLYDVKIPVGPKSRLTYKIFADMISDDLTYPSTNSAVDLRFTDGTYLSDLNPVDDHGMAASPSGQGAAKKLYANQWNSVRVDIGRVAAGKTIDRILVGYDNAKASDGTRFAGWLDDLTVQGKPAAINGSDLTTFVDVRRGTNSSGSFSRGNNLPISAVPNGFTFFTPVTDADSSSWEYSYQSQNNAQNKPVLQGLAVSHEPSPWMGDRNQLSVMPSPASGVPSGAPAQRGLAFDHATEVARPDYYKADLEGGIRAETAPGDHGGIMRFTFPSSARTGSLVLDTVSDQGSFTVTPGSKVVTGWVDDGSGLSAGRSRMFVYGELDHAPTAAGTAPGSHTGTRYATFDTSSSKQVVLRLATSFISLDQARKNHVQELFGRSFDTVRKAANTAWNQRLGVVRVKGARESDETTLYSNLYRLNLYPNSQFENTGTAVRPRYQYASPVAARTGSPTPTQTNAAIKDGKIYVNNGFWDTYRTVWPAYSLLYPDVAAQLVDGFVQQYRDGGWVARWSSPGYADLMTGTSSDAAFADAYLKGVRLPDPMSTYNAALRNATVRPPSSAVGRKGITTSTFKGYTDTSTGESVSWGLEGFINDAGVGDMAAALAKDPATPAARRGQLTEEAQYFQRRSTGYATVFNPATGFFQSRTPAGAFPATFDPQVWGNPYTETDGWNFAFHAPHDGNGLAALLGGQSALRTRLDTFFSTPEKADKPGAYGGTIHEMLEARDVRMGQLGQSNQVSHHIPYMYNYAGAPAKTAEKVREITRRLYVGEDIGQGYPGDEDNGEMSAWYVLSSLGIYPLQVGSDRWTVGSPTFAQMTVRRPGGNLVVTAKGNSDRNVYVQSLTVNGVPQQSLSISQSALTKASRIDFTMGGSPSSFGTRPQDAPQGPTPAGQKPTPLADVTGPGRGTGSAAAVFDDTSATEATFDSATPTVSYTLSGAANSVGWYTLTSGSKPGDLSAWRLEGSTDGTTWTTLDQRTGQRFTWRSQTRPFKIAKPGSYTRFRLVATASTTATPSLAELEVLR
ncbi:GH92 family glycosyl hydrolase [Luteipulveratus sp. YIM 133132]|uniref:GH92 family glycosyl hydrolase n=1 Tax=Luteipulveratus flavus TaxID=3031728 RepID=UPI0023AF44F0|nr:GH92 family glycosyl hydrolase [Luteipulveratus sp. YIM 133132]MDE9366678.1 GH92 family glycosyl hydrolase [Luteipulveratus sp. YIM 133132]